MVFVSWNGKMLLMSEENIRDLLLQENCELILSCNGKLLTKIVMKEEKEFESILNKPIMIMTKMIGGKGGFGSMLRSMGSRAEKTRNKDACRGLDGRRLRETTVEKKIQEHKEKINNKSDIVGKKTIIEKLKSRINPQNMHTEENKKSADTYMENLKKSSNLIKQSVLSKMELSLSDKIIISDDEKSDVSMNDQDVF